MQIRVVVAADFPMVREAIVRELAVDPAIEVVGEATDGDDAIALTRDLLPDVMVLDLHTPGMGVDVLGRLSGAGSPIRVVAMTAGEQASWPHAAVAAGAAGVLSERSTGEQVRSAVLAVHGGSGVVMAATLVDPLLADDAGTGDHGYGAVSKRIGPRELAVLQLVAQGMTDAEIGVALGVSVSTVNKRLARVRQKTGLRRRSALVSWVVQHGSPDRAPAGRAGG